MSLLVVSEVSKSFGAEEVLSSIAFRLAWGQRVGLVGRNGAGKTTLLRILTGAVEPDKGSVRFANGVRAGYLRQEAVAASGRTVAEEAERAFEPVLAMERRLRSLEQEMGTDDERLQSVLDEYSLLRDRFEAMGGYQNLRDIPAVLSRFGFAGAALQKPADRLSGGEKTRLELAKLLLSAPDILLLDEPTNHLDLAATEWLEGFLQSFGGAIVVVSHDRYFLDRVANQIADLDRSKLVIYPGNFTAYRRQKEAKLQKQAEDHARAQREIARLTEFFEKWKNTPSKRSQAVMRKRWADRIRERMPERAETDERNVRFRTAAALRSGEEVVIGERLCAERGGRTLFSNFSLIVGRGQRIGIVGPNGAGKSTLLRMLLGEEPPDSGSARFGANVTPGYFSQETSDLDPEATVIENLLETAPMTVSEARNHLGRFLLSGDDVFRPVATLSGGEKNRLALAMLTFLKPNLLALDEPTNHLDIASREALTAMLKLFHGTLLLVSHDRYLLDEVTEATIEVDGGRARYFDRGYSAYREIRDHPSDRELIQNRAVETPKGPAPTAGMNSYELSKARRKAAAAVTASEKAIAETEDWLKRIEEALSEPLPGDDAVKLSSDYEMARTRLDAEMQRWEEAVAYAEAIGAAV